jgi:hypothetical protein
MYQMKTFAFFLFLLIVPFSIHAMENKEKQTVMLKALHEQKGAVNYLYNQQINFLDQYSTSFHRSESALKEEIGLFTEISIYLMIILVYSLYWFKNSN